jgi:hypothetical protein
MSLKLWKRYSFYKGYLPRDEADAIRDYAVISLTLESSKVPEFVREPSSSRDPLWGKEGSQERGQDKVHDPGEELATTPGTVATPKLRKDRRFFMMKKQTMPPHSTYRQPWMYRNRCLELCAGFVEGKCSTKGCQALHIPLDHPELIEIKTDPLPPSDEVIVSTTKLGAPQTISAPLSDFKLTAGLAFCCALKQRGIAAHMQAIQCKHEKCKYGSNCIYVHRREPLDEASVTDAFDVQQFIDANTPIEQAVPILVKNEGFLKLLHKMGIATVGDIQLLSTTAFEALVERTEKDQQYMWGSLFQLRDISPAEHILTALLQFPGIEDVSPLIEARVESVKHLLDMKPKQFYALRLPPRLLDASERLRQRFEVEADAYTTIDVTGLARESFLYDVVQRVLEFRLTHAHNSWRKQDDTRPIVTSLITYVEAGECHCLYSCTSATQTPAIGITPMKEHRSAATTYPAESWCRCPRKYELAVNYELSTPSGSRCSEQNCLGKLASMGVPTDAVREVFVHGDSHKSEDPNPLFPCGVCENMFKRITGDVQRRHGGDVQLYMFDAVRNVRRLIMMPVHEISHRSGAHFKRFMQDLREDDD